MGGMGCDIQVDFLTHEVNGQGGAHRHRRLQGNLMARRARGAALALTHHDELRLHGELPDGGHAEGVIAMSDVVGCVGMKGLALGSRYSEKDAYDLVAVVGNYGSGPDEVARSVRPFIDEPLMAEALGHIRAMFRDERASGPNWAAGFHTDARDETYRRLVVRAHAVMSVFLETLG